MNYKFKSKFYQYLLVICRFASFFSIHFLLVLSSLLSLSSCLILISLRLTKFLSLLLFIYLFFPSCLSVYLSLIFTSLYISVSTSFLIFLAVFCFILPLFLGLSLFLPLSNCLDQFAYLSSFLTSLSLSFLPRLFFYLVL